MNKSLSHSEASLCISRERGRINRDVWHCREKLQHCSNLRAFWCITCGSITMLFRAIWKMFFLI